MSVNPTGHIQGRALVLGHDVNTDELHPSRFFSLNDDTVRSGFLQAVPGRRGEDVSKGRIVVAGRNFGVGSSRETGARVFVLAGVRAVIAESFGRIFIRNLTNLGLPAIVAPGVSERVADGDALSVDLTASTLHLPNGSFLPLAPLDPFLDAVQRAGGLVAYLGLPTSKSPG